MSPSPLIVLITGANQGLGYGMLTQLCAQHPEGIYLLGCRNVTAGEAAASKLRLTNAGLNLSVLELDVTVDAHITRAAAQIEQAHGRLDVLVNNAGYLYAPGVEDMSQRAALTAILDLNAVSSVVLTTQLLPLLHRSADPKVINVTSGTASMARVLAGQVPSTLAYGGSKIALNGFGVQLQGLEWSRARSATDSDNEQQQRQARAAQFPDARLRKVAMRGGVPELDPRAPPVRIFTVAPGVTRSNFTNQTIGRDPEVAAEVVLRLALDGEQTYPGGTFWEVSDEGEMRQVPW